MYPCLPGSRNRLAAWLLAMREMRAGRRAWLRWDGVGWAVISGETEID